VDLEGFSLEAARLSPAGWWYTVFSLPVFNL
jgi:hypothetical protein